MRPPRSITDICALHGARGALACLLLFLPVVAWPGVSPIKPPADAPTGFEKLSSPGIGVDFQNALADLRAVTNRNLLSGSGLALGDVDGDGWCDVYFCGLDPANALYRNLGGWRFTNITAQAGVACAGQDSTGAVFADVDGDGDLDLLVNSLGGGTRLFLNNGRGVFTEATESSGLRSKSGAMSMALADVDGDGDLDLYVANFRPTTLKDQPRTRFRVNMIDGHPVVVLVDGRPATLPEYTNRFVVSASGNVIEQGEPDALYLNDGKGRFTQVSWTGGGFLDEAGNPLKEAPQDWGLAVQFHDVNGDGAPDIYVCNDLFTPDRFWINDGKGRFRAAPKLALRGTSTFSMGVDFADINRDGQVDFFVVDMMMRDVRRAHTQVGSQKPIRWPIGSIDNRPQWLRNTLQLNRGDGTFAEISQFAGVEATDWSWTPVFLDVDLDGYEDLLVSNGQRWDFQNVDAAAKIDKARLGKNLSVLEEQMLTTTYPDFKSPNAAYRNIGGLKFEDAAAKWHFDHTGVSQGMALADLDNDGDLDVVMNNLDGPPFFLRNTTPAPRLLVRLKGRAPNTQGIGARILVEGGPAPQSQEVISGGRYMSGDDPVRVFATGRTDARLTVSVRWMRGFSTVVSNVPANSIMEIEEPEAGATQTPAPTPASPFLFEDVSDRLNHVHVEEPFDDFERQPLLPRRLSQLGPGISWVDLDGDGWDDLIIGGGKGGRLAAFKNLKNGRFEPLPQEAWSRLVTRDTTSLLLLPGAAGGSLLIGSANYEDGLAFGPCVRRLDLATGAFDESIPAREASTGPLALADVDGDGDLDCFVGGRVLPGKYPLAADSLVLINDNGVLTPDAKSAGVFRGVGLVSGAVFSDLNRDGRPDLAVACEWGPVRVFLNLPGGWKEATQEMGLASYRGWWSGITTADVDGDGDQDLIVTNWGLNSRHRVPAGQPLRLFAADLDANGTLDLVEQGSSPTTRGDYALRSLTIFTAAMPGLQEKGLTHEAFGSMTLAELFGPALQKAAVFEVDTLASTVLINHGSKFEAVELPVEAQLSAGFGVTAADADGDGAVDLFLAQNFSATHPEHPRLDAGRGLWLRGNGRGGFKSVDGTLTGVKVYGEQRGCAAADFDHDGRPDLVVTQNGAATRLFRNTTAKPALRVRLRGGASNPDGIGASIRLLGPGDVSGPAVELHRGSGYWSCDSAFALVSAPFAADRVEVRWGWKGVSTVRIPEGAVEVEVREGVAP